MTTKESVSYRTSYPGYYQIAYVSNDMGLAMQRLGQSYGIKKWYENSGFVLPTNSGKTATINFALAYVGDTQIEVIEPAGGDDGVYREPLAGDGFRLTFHHLCKAFDTREAYLAQFEQLQRDGVWLPIILPLEPGGIGLACYADMRESVGHYLEYVWLTEAGRAWMEAVPRN